MLKGLETLAVRVDYSNASAHRVAEFLEGHPSVSWVKYPFLESHPQYDLAKRQMRGGGTVVTFELASAGGAGNQDAAKERAFEVLDKLQVIDISNNLGDAKSLITHPATTTHRAMGPEGRVVALDISKEFTDLARKAWDKAGVADRIDLRIAPALESLEAMVAAGEAGRYDFAFIDADKENYDGYYERCLVLLRKGGLIGIDNVLWSGRVIEDADTSADTQALRALNKKLAADERVTLSMVPIGDGLTLARKR